MIPGPSDLAIIGGGPAGCSAGITAARSGLRTIIFEKYSYPHDKLCGEFLSPECRGILDELGVWESIQRNRPHPITRAVLTASDGFAWETDLSGTAWGFSRMYLDALLAERAESAGAEVYTGATVDQIHGSLDNGFILEGRSASGRFSTAARTVIAAYGKRSSLDRKLNRQFIQRQHPYIAFKAHFTDIPVPGLIQLHGFKGGYCGLSLVEADFAHMPVTNVCFLARADVFQGAQQAGQRPLDSFLQWMRAQNPLLHDLLGKDLQLDKDWISISQVPFSPKSPFEGDLLMAGDAAGVIVPLVGDGISMALRSGMLAAGSISHFLNENLSSAWLRRSYEQKWKQMFSRRLALGRLLQVCMLNPGLFSTGLRLLRSFPPLGNYLLTHTREAY